jgi:phosphoribosylformylglycinamidine cyclo-ligase
MKYAQRGVSASKDEVHEAIRHLDKGIFPGAFCKILPDVAGGDPEWCNLMHADTAGTKTALAYLYWRETGDLSVWAGIAQDAIVMNLDDMACVGCLDQILLSGTIGRNKRWIPGEVIAAVIEGGRLFCEKMADYGVQIHLAGGETADVGDVVRTIDVGYTTFARMRRNAVLDARIRPGDAVVGFASYGKAVYEDEYNSGIGSNGLTSARHDVLSKYYAEHFPESFEPGIPEEVAYCGGSRLTDTFEGHLVGKLLLSPTRTFLPMIKVLLDEMRPSLHGLIHNTGGGQSKVKKFLHGCKVVKNNLFAPPPVFRLIAESSGTPAHERYQVFNMGCRLEAYLSPEAAEQAVAIARAFGIEAQVIGHVAPSEGESVVVEVGEEKLVY